MLSGGDTAIGNVMKEGLVNHFSLGLLGLACFYSSRVGFEIGFLYSPYHKLAIKRKLINAVELLYCGEIGSPEYKFLRWRKVSHKRSKTKFETGKSG